MLNYHRLNYIAGEKIYSQMKPFPYTVIDEAVDDTALREVLCTFPHFSQMWNYDNDFEKKFAMDDTEKMHHKVRQLMWEFNSKPFVDFLEKLTGINGLMPDHTYRGGGCHEIHPGGKLEVHADFNWHPKLKIYRRVNVILYLNENWLQEYGGLLELWKKDMSKPEVLINPCFNRLVVFNSTETSYHGHPHPLVCPKGMSRKSIAVYYYTAEAPPNVGSELHSVTYKKREGEIWTAEQEALQKARAKFREIQ